MDVDRITTKRKTASLEKICQATTPRKKTAYGFTPPPLKSRSLERGCRAVLGYFSPKPRALARGTGFTLFEAIIVIAIIALLARGMVAMVGSFSHRQELEIAASKLAGDLRQTWQFSRAQKDGYKFFGLRLFNGLGQNLDRYGYKILRFEPPVGVAPLDQVPPIDPNKFTVIKSSVQEDNPQFLEDAFFGQRIIIGESSEFKPKTICPACYDTIVFTPEGSATYDGILLLTASNDSIVLSLDARTKTITIVPLVGHVQVQ